MALSGTDRGGKCSRDVGGCGPGRRARGRTPPVPLVSGKSPGRIALDSAGQGSGDNPPLTAYDPTLQTTYVAWTALPENTGIDLCIFPNGATGCTGVIKLADPLFTGDNTATLSGLVVLPGGETVVLGASPEGSVAWASSPGGGGFSGVGQGLENGGHPISDASSFYQPGDVVGLGTIDLGILDGQHNEFSDAPYAASGIAPQEPAEANVDFADPPLFTNGAPQVAAEPAPGGGGNELVVTAGLDDTNATQAVARVGTRRSRGRSESGSRQRGRSRSPRCHVQRL